MVSAIRVYFEGDKALRRGFSQFLREVIDIVRERRINWDLISGGSRSETFRDFATALETHPDAFNVLLVDSELAVVQMPCKHLEARNGWLNPGVKDEHVHFMAQTMEAWLVADKDTLQNYYGDGFRPNSISNNPNVGTISKADLLNSLENATRDTRKGRYHKTRHAPDLLRLVDSMRVRAAAPNCRRLFETLHLKIRP